MKKRRIFALIMLAFILCTGSGSASRAEPAGYIALTFDDGPSGRITRRLLEGLESRNVKATFFLCGYRLEEYPQVAPLIAAGGHEIGLHGFSHNSMKDMDTATLQQELHHTRRLILEQTGLRAVLLRPPGGLCGQLLSQVATAEGMPIVLWSLDTKDWAKQDASFVADRIIQTAQDGDIVLLHDMQMSTVEGALRAVDTLAERGFCFVTVSRLASLRGVTLQGGMQYRRLPPPQNNGLK